MTKTRKTRRTAAYKPAEMKEGRFYADLGSCGCRSLAWSDAHDPTETTAAQASCLRYNGRDYHETGKQGTRIADGKPCREFSSNDGITESRLWLTNDGEISLDD